MTYQPNNTLSPFLPTSTYFPEDFEQFRIKYLDIYRQSTIAINSREISIYDPNERINGQSWQFSSNLLKEIAGFRKMFETGAIAPGATLTTAHGISQFNTLTFTKIIGIVKVNAGTFNQRPLPYVDAATVTNNIQLDADNTNFRIINGATAPAIISGIIILEYLKT